MAYEDTLKNAKNFSKVWQPMQYFHVRPTSSGATIVCTIPQPRIAMRGRQKASLSYIKEHYNDLRAITPDMNDDVILDKLKGLGFSERKSDANEKEKLIQAKFINMIYYDKNVLSDSGYRNVRFIASEMVYTIKADTATKTGARKGIADVIAESDDYIMLIEIKKGAGRNSGDDEKQIENYRNFYFVKHADKTYDLLKNYPNHKIAKDKPVKMIYLLGEGNGAVGDKNTDILRFNDGGVFSVHR